MVFPNIVFVFADQMGAHTTGYAGDPNVKTPYLDQLSRESLSFENAVSHCPICTPYRACLLSGQYPLTTGLFLNDLCLPDNGNSLGQTLRRGGYDTAWIGKWHLDGHGRKSYIPPERRQGFDYWKVLECTHDYPRSQYYASDDATPRFWDGYDAYAQTDDAVDYITRRGDTSAVKPFALFVSFGTPHDPYDTAPEDLKALYPPDQLILRENVAPHRRAMARKQLQGYYGHVTAIDQCVHKINQAIESINATENTIFIFTSDHGDMLESHCDLTETAPGARKQAPYDESVRVPFLLRYPKRYGREGRTITTPVTAPDIMPTLLTLCGQPIPQTVEGVDFSAAPEGKAPRRLGTLIANYHPFADWRTERGGRPYRGIRTETHTYVRDLNGPWLLFDNQNDPFQRRNLVNKQRSRDTQRQLDQALSQALKERNDTFERPETLRLRWNYHVDDVEENPYHD